MGNAIWLILAVPQWYFSTVLQPTSGGMLTAVPAVGVLALAVGLMLAFTRRERRLFLFMIPFGASELFVATAGVLRGQLRGSSGELILLTFLALQLLLAGFLIFRSKRNRRAASAFAIFSVTYAAFAAFIAGMSFTDDWL